MKIRDIHAFGLRGKTPEGGWTNELQPEDCVHTLVAVRTDEGAIGMGQRLHERGRWCARRSRCFEPLYQGENALEPERVSEKLHQNTFWLGRGGAITHTISGIDIALWDLLGKASGQPVGRLLGGRYRERVRPYASLLMREPERMPDELLPVKAQGFRAFKIGWGPFGRRNDAMDEAIVRAAREAVGAGLPVDGGCGRKRRVLAAGLQMGAAARRRCWPTTMCTGLRRHSTRTHWTTTSAAAGRQHPDRRRRGPDAAAVLPTVAGGRRIRYRAARRNQGRRHQRGTADCLDGSRARSALHPARMEHGCWTGRGPATRVGFPIPTWLSI